MQGVTGRSLSRSRLAGSVDVLSARDEAILGRFLAKPGFLLARVDQICTSIYSEISSGETLAQAEFLLLLDRLGLVPQIALARAAGVDKSTTAYVLDNLEARGWVERAADPTDRRRVVVALTPAGATRAVQARSDYLDLQDRLAVPLDAEAVSRLLALLHGIASNPMGPAPLWTPGPAGEGTLDRAPSFLFRRAMQLFEAQFLACAKSLNLTPRQFSLLFILSVQPEITQVGFARLFGLDPSTCAVVMRNLAARGLVEGRPSDEDRRMRIYRLTPAGHDVFLTAQPMVERSERLVFRGEPAREIRWMVRQLQAIVHIYSHKLRFPGAIAGR